MSIGWAPLGPLKGAPKNPPKRSEALPKSRIPENESGGR